MWIRGLLPCQKGTQPQKTHSLAGRKMVLSFCLQISPAGPPIGWTRDPESMGALQVNLQGHGTEGRNCQMPLEGQMENPQLPKLSVQTNTESQGLGMPNLGSCRTWQPSTTLTSPQRTRSERAKWGTVQSWATLQAPPLALSLFTRLPREGNQARKRTGPLIHLGNCSFASTWASPPRSIGLYTGWRFNCLNSRNVFVSGKEVRPAVMVCICVCVSAHVCACVHAREG